MKLNSILVLCILSIIICAPVHAGTVDEATLDPSYNFAPAGALLTYTFSAVNDKGFPIKSYAIDIGFDEGLDISNLITTPVADVVSIDSRKRLISLTWSSVSPGSNLQAGIDVTGAAGTYVLTPAQSTYTDYNKISFTGTCNTAQAEFLAPLPPLAPYNVSSQPSGSGAIHIDWGQVQENQISEYRVFRRTADTSYDPSIYFTTSSTNYLDSTVTAGTVYYYQIAAISVYGLVSDVSIETACATVTTDVLRTYDISDSLYANSTAATVGGDFNGDGVPDLCVGLPNSGVRKNQSGKVLIFYGNGSLSDPDVTLYGEAAYNRFGASLAAADMNNDGFDELIVGAPDYDDGTDYQVGKIYIYAGSANFDTNALAVFIGQSTQYLYNEQLGSALTAVGDANGDGYNDVAASAPYGGQDHHGKVALLYGGPNTYAGSVAFQGPNAGMLLGAMLARAGDVNGDGFSDLIAGAGDQNAAYLILGGTSPQLLETTYFTHIDNNANMVAEDINGDGFSDLVLSQGIYLGAATIDNTVDFNAPNAGPFVTLGDLDSDGFRDLLLGSDILWGDGNSVSTSYIYNSYAPKEVTTQTWTA